MPPVPADRAAQVAEAARKQAAYARDRKAASETVRAFYRDKFGEAVTK